jgi:hypothetical protein
MAGRAARPDGRSRPSTPCAPSAHGAWPSPNSAAGSVVPVAGADFDLKAGLVIEALGFEPEDLRRPSLTWL